MAGVLKGKATLLAARVLLALVLVVGPAASEAKAAIAFVKNVGTASSKTLGTTLAVTLAAGVNVPAGDSVFVTFAMDPGAGPVSCADSKGNVYSNDADVTNGSLTSGVRTLVFSAPMTTALAPGDTITVTTPSIA